MTATSSYPRRPAWTGKRLVTVVDFATASHARAVAVLVLFALLSFLPGFFQVPPIDRDEARFAQATKQMLEHHDYIDIRFQDEVRYKKPVGIYWLQAAVVNTAEALGVPEARTTIALYRIPSLFGAIGAHSVIVFGTDGPLVDNWLAAIPAGRMPRIYLDLGDSDSGLANARKFEVELTAADIPHEWHVNIGYHDETYWSAHVLEYLQWYAEGFAADNSTPAPVPTATATP